MRYTRIPGKKGGLYRRCTLWMGDDHLLAVESTGYTEQYRRLYYKDMQAVIIRETSRKRDLGLLFASFAFLAALPALIHLDPLESPLSLAGILTSAAFLSLLLVNLYKGPTCTCSIQMPVAVHGLPSLRRRKNVELFLSLLKPRVEKLQGKLSRDELRAGLYRLTVSSPQVSPMSPILGGLEGSQPRVFSSRIHGLAFGFLLLDAALTWLSIHHNNLLLTMLTTLVGMALFALLITGAARQKRSSLPAAVKTLLWSGIMVFLSYNLIYWVFIYAIFILGNQVEVFRDQWSLFSAVAELNPVDHPTLIKVMMGYTITAFIIGLSALLALAMDRWPRKTSGAELTMRTSEGLQ